MVHLNHFHRLKYLLTFLVGKYFLICTSYAGDIQFFDPTKTYQTKTAKTEYKMFLANDPVSIDEFLHNWGGDYTPETGENIALLDSRFDFGFGVGDHYYFGYFYQHDLFVDTDKDFTDLFYAIKNKNNLEVNRDYILRLDIEGIKQNGLIFSGNIKFVDTCEYSVCFGGAFYLSYGLEMQNGFIYGNAKAIDIKDYNIDASSSYYYTHNYLYDLDIKSSSGYGYGSHMGLYFENKKYNLKINFLINDLASKMYWKDLPYSKVFLKTENKSKDSSGYVKYSPSISGFEKYVDFTQNIEQKYKFESSIKIEDTMITGGIDLMYGEKFPYVEVLQEYDESQILKFMYESRFGSFGFGYHYDLFNISIMADKFTNISSFGVNSSFIYRY